MTEKTEKKIDKKNTVKVGVKNKAAFVDQVGFGSQINLWGNIFTVGEKGELEAELPVNIAEDGIKVGRYIKL